MADVRSMLRQEQAARQQSNRPQTQSAMPAPAPLGKKRKAVDEEFEERKRSKAEEIGHLPSGFFDERSGANAQNRKLSSNPQDPAQSGFSRKKTVVEQDTVAESVPSVPERVTTAPAPPTYEIDDDELAAFERELATPPPEKRTVSTYAAGTIIEAAPINAAELAAQAREDQSAQRGRREAEIEAEKEDAARLLEEEFDEMAELEQRVQKLREKRETLRRINNTESLANHDQRPAQPKADEESEEDDDDDWDDWTFRRA